MGGCDSFYAPGGVGGDPPSPEHYWKTHNHYDPWDLEAALIATCSVLEAENMPIPKKARPIWLDCKRRIAKEKREREEKARKKAIAQQAVAKLTAEEAEALGIKPPGGG